MSFLFFVLSISYYHTSTFQVCATSPAGGGDGSFFVSSIFSSSFLFSFDVSALLLLCFQLLFKFALFYRMCMSCQSYSVL